MTKKGDYTIKNLYQGGYSTLNPSKNEYFTGYNATAGSLGITTNPRTANIIQDVSTKLSGGSKHVELALVTPQILNAIPKQHLKEVNRLAKLIGVDVSVHGPVIDSAGMTQNGWSEAQRQSSERKILNTLERSKDMSTTGNTIVVFHSAEGITGTEWETLGKDRKARKLIAVDRETGQMAAMEKEQLYYPDMHELKESSMKKYLAGELNQITPNDFQKFNLDKGKVYTPENRLTSRNNTLWDNELKKIIFETEAAEKTLRNIDPNFRKAYVFWRNGQLNVPDMTPQEMEEIKKVHFAAEHMEEASLSLKNSFSKAYKLFKEDKNQKALDDLRKISEEYRKNLGIEDEKSFKKFDPQTQSVAMMEIVDKLSKLTPKQFVPIEEFAVDQSSKTFGNAAFNAYKQFGDKSPIMAIENPPAGFGLSTGEDLANLVKASRKEFATKLAQEKGIGEGEAKKIAEKFIGATWDVGHINMLRGQGFSEENILKETEKVAPYLKHVHLSDNFGFEHTELPMGMGNVPMKKIMEKLGQKGFEAKKIVEAGDWWQHFQTNPMKESLEGMGSPIYSDGAGPYWNQTLGFQQGYFGGYGAMLPQTHFNQLYGAGFTSTSLPFELGGNVGGGAGGRMGGGRE